MQNATTASGQLPPAPTQQEATAGSDDEEVINVEESKPQPPVMKTAADGTIRIRRQPAAPGFSSGPLCCSGGSAVGGEHTAVVGAFIEDGGW